MSDKNHATSAAESASEVCSAAEALKRAKAEFEKAQAYYETIRHDAVERVKAVRKTSVGDMIDGTLEAVRRRPGASLTIAALVGFFLAGCSTLTMPARITPDDLLRRKRELRLRIGRSRRRINGQLRATRDRAAKLLCWRTYVIRYPAWALAAAMGAGLAASAGFKPARMSRWLGLSLVRHAMGGFQQHVRPNCGGFGPTPRPIVALL